MVDHLPPLLDLNDDSPSIVIVRRQQKARLVGIATAVSVLVVSVGVMAATKLWLRPSVEEPPQIVTSAEPVAAPVEPLPSQDVAVESSAEQAAPASPQQKLSRTDKKLAAPSTTPFVAVEGRATETATDATESAATENTSTTSSTSEGSSPSTIYRGTSCTVDASAATELAEFAQTIGAICDREYPVLVERLSGTKRAVTLVFKSGMANVGETSGTTISLQSNWFVQYPSDTGAIVHELVHVAQGYPPGSTFWLTEGMADYYRYELGYANSWSYAHCGSGSERYSSGYWCGAAFLAYLKKTYGSEILSNLNEALRAGTYTESLFQTFTGKQIEGLWSDCLAADCRGGTP